LKEFTRDLTDTQIPQVGDWTEGGGGANFQRSGNRL
jgi:hypothetical protein